MKKSVRTLLAVCSLESDLSYSFPYVEGIVVIFLFTAFISVFSAVAGGPYINIRPGLAWNTTQSVATYEEYRNTMAASVYGVSALGFSYILAFLVPLLTTFTLTGHFEDGTLPTYLSYPISRSSLLLVKASMLIIVLGLSTTVSALSVVLFFSRGVPLDTTIILLLAALWSYVVLLTCVTTLVGVLSKNAGATAIVGVLLWYVITMIVATPLLPDIARGVLNPILAVAASVGSGAPGLHIGEALIGVGGASLIGLVALIVSVIVFERSEL
jgi:ABC-type transport system involved in multi-copper enzyme maturation permease subunit